VENNNLATHKLANLYHVINIDGTPNKVGQITEYVRAYVEIGSHKTTQHLFVTNLGNKEIIIGYSYLYKHNPNIDWQKGQWEFTRCLDTCAERVQKRIAHWDKQNHAVPAPNCVLKVQGEIIKVEGL